MNMRTAEVLEESTGAEGSAPAGNRVLVVGDDAGVRNMLVSLLSEAGYVCDSAADAGEARTRLSQDDFGVVLTDMDLGGLSGLDLVVELSQDHPDTALFLLTGMNDPSMVGTALEMGAYGYMVKPLEPNEVLINVANALRRRDLERENKAHRDRLQTLVTARTGELREAVGRLQRVETELRSSREETIERLSIAAEFRDNETMRHIKRVSGYCEVLARAVGYDKDQCEMIRIASQLHDVGKIGIPDHILLKQGPLTDEERTAMQQHTELGYRILAGSGSEVLTIAASIALTHHERFDGGGYPRGLSGESIPVEGRMMAVADVFDGLTSRRVYKNAVPMHEALAVLGAEADNQLDGDLVDVFLSSMDYIHPIRGQYPDS